MQIHLRKGRKSNVAYGDVWVRPTYKPTTELSTVFVEDKNANMSDTQADQSTRSTTDCTSNELTENINIPHSARDPETSSLNSLGLALMTFECPSSRTTATKAGKTAMDDKVLPPPLECRDIGHITEVVTGGNPFDGALLRNNKQISCNRSDGIRNQNKSILAACNSHQIGL